MKGLSWLLLGPLGLQAAAMMVDELRFHRQRGLGRWERIGHPLDTMTVMACLVWILEIPPSPRAILGYLGMATISCAFITKDECVHARRCSAGEHWLHALLFVLHPICLASFGLLWPGLHSGAPGLAARVIPGQLVLTSAFCLYQILYWNIPWHRPAPPP